MEFFTERPYQQESADAAIDYLSKEKKNPVVVLPTGTGKTIVIAGIIDRWLTENPASRVLLLSHVKSILEQDYKALVFHFGAGIGIFSCGLGSREVRKITVAGIQSVNRNINKFRNKGFDLVVVDEAHMVNHKKQGMYRKLINGLDNPRVVGLTASPYRLGHGYINEGENTIFDEIVCDYSSSDKFHSLINDGYLVPIIGKGTLLKMNTDNMRMVGGDFNSKDLSNKFDRDEITEAAVQEVVAFGKNYQKWLFFAIDIKHAEHIADCLASHGISAAVVHSKADDNSPLIESFRNTNKYRALVNVNMLTTGFDVPSIDLIAMMRPTSSPVIHVQTAGRGTRPVYPKGFDLSTKEGRLAAIKASGKDHCLMLDFGGNIKRLGTIDNVTVKRKEDKKKGTGGPMVKECKNCGALNHIKRRECMACEEKFEIKERLTVKAGNEDAISNNGTKRNHYDPVWKDVTQINYCIHRKPGMPDSLRIDYYCGIHIVTQFVCPEHGGYPGAKAKTWIKNRFNNPPQTAKELYERRKEIPVPDQIYIQKKDKFYEVLQARKVQIEAPF